MTTQAPFALSRASIDDMDELLNLQYDCFPEFIRNVFMGCFSKDDLPRIKSEYVRKMKEDPSEVWVKVVDKKNNKIIAVSAWNIYLHGETPGEPSDTAPEWLEGEMLEQSKMIINSFTEPRNKAMPGPYIHLHICFTSADYRRRGAGSLMMKWGCDVADLLGLPGWIEASEEGNFLYKTFGFYDYEKIESVSGMAMKRDARSTAVEGGNVKP